MESPWRSSVHTEDEWVRNETSLPKMQVPPDTLSHIQSVAQQWWLSNQRHVGEVLVPYAINCLTVDGEEPEFGEKVVASLECLQERGSSRDRKEAMHSSARLRGNEVGETFPFGEVGVFRRVKYSDRLYCAGVSVVGYPPPPHAIDYGDRARARNQTKRLAGRGGDIEFNQCAIIGLAAGMEALLQKQPLRSPFWARAESLAGTIRDSECNFAWPSRKEVSKPPNQAESGVRSISQNAIIMRRCRDIRDLHISLIPPPVGMQSCNCGGGRGKRCFPIRDHAFSRESQVGADGPF